VGLRQVWPPI
jgi:hypothetical protein